LRGCRACAWKTGPTDAAALPERRYLPLLGLPDIAPTRNPGFIRQETNTVKSQSPRWRRLFAWVRRHPYRTAALIVLVFFLLLNFLAYQHARAMLTFSADTTHTRQSYPLSLWQKVKLLVCGITVPRPINTRSPQDLDLPSETLHISTDDGLSLEGWLVVPPKPRGTVLLFHGYAASRASLLEQARFFHQKGFATLLIDFRGSGGSDGSTTTLGYHEARDVAAAVRHVRTLGLPRPLVLYGQSMGGAAVLRSVAALDVGPDAVILESVFDRTLTTVRNRFGRLGVPSFPAAELLVFWGGVQVGFSGFGHNPVEYARRCDCAALVLHGAEDPHAKPEEGRAIYENLAGRKEWVVFPRAGHVSLLEADPDQWKAAVGSFLAKQAEAVSRSGR
jgi:alpha-beta hydrolase superfamily lysophospholipase